MKFYRHSSLLDRILSEPDLISVDLSPSDFQSVLGEVARMHYDHNQYPDFETDCLNTTKSFTVNGISFDLVDDEPDE